MNKKLYLNYLEDIIIIIFLLQIIACNMNKNLRKIEENKSDSILSTISTILPPTLPTILPSTLPTTLPSALPTTFPTTIVTIMPTNLYQEPYPTNSDDSFNKSFHSYKIDIMTSDENPPEPPINQTTDIDDQESNIQRISFEDNQNDNQQQYDDKGSENTNEEEIKEEDETLCEYEDVIKGNCSQGKMDLDYIDIIKENLFNEEGDDFYKKIKTGNVIIQFSNLDEQDDNETSSIDLGDYESKLRTIYEIPDDMQLIVYKVDIKNSDASSTYVQYEVYNPVNKSLLNLNICDSITVNTPVNISNEMEEIYNSLSESGYNLFDSEDDFYQDICSTYTTANGTDMLLSDRKKDIYSTTEDKSLCQTGCELESYNSTTKKAKCNCEVSTTSSVNSDLDIDSLFTKETIKSSFYETLASSNFRVLQCYKIVFSNNIKKNIGQIFMTAVAVIFICFNSFSFLIYQKQINSFIISISDINNDNVINSSPMNEKKNDINNINNSEVDEKKEKKSKKKKKKKKKAKKEENTNLFPPKKLKKKNKMNQMEIQISHDELVNKDKIDSNTNNINIIKEK